MNQENNSIPELEKEKVEEIQAEVKDSIPNNGKNFYTELVKSMLVDYVVNDLSVQQLSDKYHITIEIARKIYKGYSFQKRKEDYQNKLYDAVLKKVAKSQTGLIAKITEAITIQVNRILLLQAKDPTYMISNNNMKDLLSSLTIFTREFKDSTNPANDKRVVNINVEMPNYIPIVTDNNKTIVDINNEEPINVEPEIKEQSKEEIKVEIPESEDLFGGFVE